MQVNPNGAQLHAITGVAASAKPAQADAARFQAQLQSAAATQPSAAPAAAEPGRPSQVQAAASTGGPANAQAGGAPAARGSVLNIVV